METNEEYMLFHVESATGKFVSAIREETENMIQDIVSKCTLKSDIKELLTNYIEENFGTKPESPFKRYPEIKAFKAESTGKNYVFIMNIPYERLGIAKKGDVNIINLKNTPERIEKLIDGEQIFEGYHMNKKYWISVIISEENFEIITELVSESYEIVSAKS